MSSRKNVRDFEKKAKGNKHDTWWTCGLIFLQRSWCYIYKLSTITKSIADSIKITKPWIINSGRIEQLRLFEATLWFLVIQPTSITHNFTASFHLEKHHIHFDNNLHNMFRDPVGLQLHKAASKFSNMELFNFLTPKQVLSPHPLWVSVLESAHQFHIP